MNSHKTILHLCADIGSDSQPYREAGYNVICIGKNIGVENYHPPGNVYGIIGNPPCTMFSFARTKAKNPRDLREGMKLVKECLRIIWECQYELISLNSKKTSLQFWMLENPNGFLRYFLGKPPLEYHPWEYGDTYKKNTHIWGNFNIPKKTYFGKSNLPKFGSDKPIAFRFDANAKSICSPKFAKAFFLVNQ